MNREDTIALCAAASVAVAKRPTPVWAGGRWVETLNEGVATHHAVICTAEGGFSTAMIYGESFRPETELAIELLTQRPRHKSVWLPIQKVFADRDEKLLLGYLTEPLGGAVTLWHFLGEAHNYDLLDLECRIELAGGVVAAVDAAVGLHLYPDVLEEDFLVTGDREVVLTGLEFCASFGARADDLRFHWLGPHPEDAALAAAEQSVARVVSSIMTFQMPKGVLIDAPYGLRETIHKLLGGGPAL